MKNNDFVHASLAQKAILRELIDRNIKAGQLDGTDVYLAGDRKRPLFFSGSFTNAVPYNLGIIFSNKYYVSRILRNNKVPVAPGRVFGRYDKLEALSFARKLGFPVILRLEQASSKVRGAKINRAKDFTEAFIKLSQTREGILVEKYKGGESHRMFITKNGYYNVLKKQLPFITGDGRSTVRDLIDKENLKRINSSDKYLQPLNITPQILQEQNLDFKTVLRKKKKIIFYYLISEKDGAAFEDITPTLNPSVIKLGQSVLKAFPGLGYLGFEIITKSCEQRLTKDNCLVSEIYVSPGPNIRFMLRKSGKPSRKAEEVIVDLLLES
jgi:cyanophycin synthetase